MGTQLETAAHESGFDDTVVTYPFYRDPASPFAPPPELTKMLKQQPLWRMRFPDGHLGWLVLGHQEFKQILRSKDVVRSQANLFPNEMEQVFTAIPPGFFAFMNPPEHTVWRKLLAPWFTPAKMKELRPFIDNVVESRLDAMEAKGGPINLFEDFALPISTTVICAILGVPREKHHDEFVHLSVEFMLTHNTAVNIKAAIKGLENIMWEVLRDKKENPGDDLTSWMLATGQATDEEIVNIGWLLLMGGHESTANQISLCTMALLANSEQYQRVVEDPSLVNNAIEETVRYTSIAQQGIVMTTSADMEVAGQIIPAGEDIVMSVVGANWDGLAYDNPGKLDVTRPNDPQHIGFSTGTHACLGSPIARKELQAALAGLVRRFPTLHLAKPIEDIPMRTNHRDYGVTELPVIW